MNLTTLFLTMCLYTALPCEDIEVSYGTTPPKTIGAAHLYRSGRMAIVIRPDLGKSDWKLRQTILHEIAHLMVYQERLAAGQPPSSTHNKQFQNACKRVSMAYGENATHCAREW